MTCASIYAFSNHKSAEPTRRVPDRSSIARKIAPKKVGSLVALRLYRARVNRAFCLVGGSALSAGKFIVIAFDLSPFGRISRGQKPNTSASGATLDVVFSGCITQDVGQTLSNANGCKL